MRYLRGREKLLVITNKYLHAITLSIAFTDSNAANGTGVPELGLGVEFVYQFVRTEWRF